MNADLTKEDYQAAAWVLKCKPEAIEAVAKVESGAYEVCAHQIQLATESKGHAELLSGQAELAAKQCEKLLAIVSDTASVLEATRADLTAWVEKGFETVTQPLSKVAGAKQAA